MSLNGVWQNSYGSVMSLTQYGDGLVAGTYRSSTGSTGEYYVLGFAAPSTPTADLGQPLALTIFWRSIAPGAADPSWHWVSGLGGQLTLQDGTPTLILLHALVATDEFPKLASPGTYLDKLIYQPKNEAAEDASHPRPAGEPGTASDPLDGHWTCEQDPSLSLRLTVLDARYGTVTGSLIATGTRAVCGFADTYAAGAGLALQGVALAVEFDPAVGCTLCLAGRRSGDRLEFTVFDNRGTAADASYVQTAGSALSFRRS